MPLVPNPPALLPLTSDILRQHMAPGQGPLDALTPFFTALPGCLAGALQALGTAPVKGSCTATAGAENPEDGGSLHGLISTAQGSLRFWLVVDRMFDHAVCEIMFGGNGAVPQGEEAERPASKLERRLRLKACEIVMDAVTDELNRHMPVSAVRIGVDVGTNTPRRPQPLACLVQDYLVNVFSLASDVRLYWCRADLENFVANAPEAKVPADAPRARDAMSECQFSLAVYLPDVEIPLQDIIMMKPGSVLPLGLAPDAIVNITCQDAPISSGRLKVQDTAVMVEIHAPDGGGPGDRPNAGTSAPIVPGRGDAARLSVGAAA